MFQILCKRHLAVFLHNEYDWKCLPTTEVVKQPIKSAGREIMGTFEYYLACGIPVKGYLFYFFEFIPWCSFKKCKF